MNQTPLRVAIVGGGIGGLTAALALLQAGVDVQVFEQAAALGEAGAGVQISPNASRVLHRLGLRQALARSGVMPLAWHQRRWDDGRTLLRSPLGPAMEAAFGHPHYQVHRADVLDALVAALPAARLHVGHRFAGFDDRGGRIELRFDDGERVAADALIGADGIHSAVRHALFGPDDARFSGCVAYRALVPAARVASLDLEVTSDVWMGPGQHLVHYFVRNRELVNIVAVVEQPDWPGESWTTAADPARASKAFAAWHPQLRALLAAVDRSHAWALFDRRPMSRWSAGRVTLLGDACHAMLPFMAQGAAQAIEDGATLAACLAPCKPGEVSCALQRYESLRRPRTARLQALSAANQTRFHMRDGAVQRERDAQMAQGATDWSLRSVAWLYGHDAGSLAPASA